MEHFRRSKNSHTEEEPVEVPDDKVLNLDDLLVTEETVELVRKVLEQMPKRDRRILKRMYFDEEDKDVICIEFGIDRDYLRVLVLRARNKFRVLYKLNKK